MQNVTESIEMYVEHFRGHLKDIQRVDVGMYASQYRKLLYVAILDTLAKCVYPRRSNRERQVALIEQFSGWEDVHRVSMPYLGRLLAKTPDPAFAKLRKFVKERSKWPYGVVGNPSMDPDIDEVKRYWPTEKEHRFPLEGVQLESLQHVHLFVTYRNVLVHEFRTPDGYALHSKEPFYLAELRGDVSDGSSEVKLLNYPVAFFENLVTKSLENLEQYLRDNEIDPYLSYVFGDYWIEELNR